MRNNKTLALGFLMVLLLCAVTGWLPYRSWAASDALTTYTGKTPYTFVVGDTTINTSGFTALDPDTLMAEYVASDVIITEGRGEMLWLDVYNTGTTGLADFKIQIVLTSDGTAFDYLSSTDFDTVDDTVRWSSTTGLHEINSSGQGQARIYIGQVYGIKLYAQASDTDDDEDRETTVVVRGRIW